MTARVEQLPFSHSPQLTLGVEVELQLLDGRSYDLCPAAPKILKLVDPAHSRIKPELFQSMIEINTGICGTVADVQSDLQISLDQLRIICDGMGIELAAAGSHPFARYQDRLIYPAERYRYLIDRNRWLARRLVIFGVHVHLGMRDGDHAMALMNGLAPYLGHFLSLSASSPYWQGEETGLASARSTVFESVPTAGTPTMFQNWNGFEGFYGTMRSSRAITSIKDLWWDIRPNPHFGTLEVRICDGLATLSETLAMVALIRCLAGRLDDDYRNGKSFPPPPSWMLRENKWRAARHGHDAEVVIDADGHTRLVADDTRRLVRELEPYAKLCNGVGQLAFIESMLEAGGSYARQRRIYAETASLRAVTLALVEEFKRDRPLASI